MVTRGERGGRERKRAKQVKRIKRYHLLGMNSICYNDVTFNMGSIVNIFNNSIWSLIYKNIKLLCYKSETNIVSHYTLILKKGGIDFSLSDTRKTTPQGIIYQVQGICLPHDKP